MGTANQWSAGAAIASALVGSASTYLSYRNAKKARNQAADDARRMQEQADRAFEEQKKTAQEYKDKMAAEEAAQATEMGRQEASKRKQRATGGRSRADTILTGSQGVTENSVDKKKTILGY